MKKLIVTILMASAAALAMADYDNSSPLSGFYVGGSLGVAHQSDRKYAYDVHTIGAASRNLIDIKHKIGFAGSLAAGYTMDTTRFEIEGLFLHNSKDKFGGISYNLVTGERGDPTEVDISKSLRQYALMINMLKDFDLTDQVSFYVGGGVGICHAKNKSNTIFNKGELTINKSSQTTAATQLLTGLTYGWNERVDLTLGYRLFATPKRKVESASNAFIGVYEETFPINQSLSLGMRYKF